MHNLGKLVDGVQDTVDAKADHADVPFGLDVNIAGSLIQCVMENVIDRILDVLIR